MLSHPCPSRNVASSVEGKMEHTERMQQFGMNYTNSKLATQTTLSITFLSRKLRQKENEQCHLLSWHSTVVKQLLSYRSVFHERKMARNKCTKALHSVSLCQDMYNHIFMIYIIHIIMFISITSLMDIVLRK